MKKKAQKNEAATRDSDMQPAHQKKHGVISRLEMQSAMLDFGGDPIDLADYQTTGILAVGMGPRGQGKTNAGLVMAEQLSEQGWVSVLLDPEGEMESLYGEAVASPEDLYERLELRDQRIVVVSVQSVEDFVPYGEVILQAADDFRKPTFVFIDEGQLFSSGRKSKGAIGEASEIINDFAERGRKRALDMYITVHKFNGSIHRSLFVNKNLTLVGRMEDSVGWSSMAQQFRASRIQFSDVNALMPHEFICFSRRGVEKVSMPMAKALAKVAPPVKIMKQALPATFSQWDAAMREIPTERLQALNDDIVTFLAGVTGLPAQKVISGHQAMADELELRQ